MESDPSDAPAAFAEYAADQLWVWSHLGQFIGVALLGTALIALASTFEPGRPAGCARIGLAGTAATIAVAAALQAVDGVTLKIMVDRWATATGEARTLAFEGAFAVRQIEIGLASLFSFLFGLTSATFSVAMLQSTRYPMWLGTVGLAGGIGTVATGAAQASMGFSDLPTLLRALRWLGLAADCRRADGPARLRPGAVGGLLRCCGRALAGVHWESGEARRRWAGL